MWMCGWRAEDGVAKLRLGGEGSNFNVQEVLAFKICFCGGRGEVFVSVREASPEAS